MHILVDYRPEAGIRIAPHFYTSDDELELAMAAIDEILELGDLKASGELKGLVVTGCLVAYFDLRARALAPGIDRTTGRSDEADPVLFAGCTTTEPGTPSAGETTGETTGTTTSTPDVTRPENVTSAAPARIRPFVPAAASDVTGPGTAATSRPMSAAQSAVIKVPDRSVASTTTVTWPSGDWRNWRARWIR